LASTLGNSDTDLMSRRAQRMSGSVITATPRRTSSGSGGFWLRAVITIEGSTPLGKGKSRRARPRVTCR
jgi:hypothetical protein